MRNDLELKRLAVSRLGKQVVELKNVTARRGEKTVLNDVTWLVGPGDRYGILGANGVGKSTLLGIIDGSLTPAAGSVKIGQTVKFAVLSQRLDELLVHTGQTVREVLNTIKRRYTIDGKEYTPAQMLERLGFEPGQQLTRVEELSGGQQRRLQLLLVLLSEPNVLILDEPGNDMDTDMLAILEDLLDSWPGTLLLVSHDRYLMERVTNDQFMVMDGKVTHVPGGVDEFLRKLDEHDRAAAATAQAQAAEKPAPSAQAAAGTGGLSRSDEYRLRKQLASVERKIEAQRKRVEETQAAMLQVAASDFVELGRLQEKVDAAQAAIDELELEWLELSEQLGE
jgi:ATPase subunit of ABC transporter with duplicated ATPase domains